MIQSTEHNKNKKKEKNFHHFLRDFFFKVAVMHQKSKICQTFFKIGKNLSFQASDGQIKKNERFITLK